MAKSSLSLFLLLDFVSQWFLLSLFERMLSLRLRLYDGQHVHHSGGPVRRACTANGTVSAAPHHPHGEVRDRVRILRRLDRVSP